MVTVSGPTVSGPCAKTAVLARRKAKKQSPCRRCRVVMSGAPGWGFYCLIMVNARNNRYLWIDEFEALARSCNAFMLAFNSCKRIDAGAKAGESVSKQSYGPNRRPIGLPQSRMNSAGVHRRIVIYACRKSCQLHLRKSAYGRPAAVPI